MKLLLVAAAITFATVADLLFGDGAHVRAVVEGTRHAAFALRGWLGLY